MLGVNREDEREALGNERRAGKERQQGRKKKRKKPKWRQSFEQMREPRQHGMKEV